MTYWAKRLGSTLIVAALTIVVACVSASGEQVRKDSKSMMANETLAISYYLHDNDVEFVIEIIPSGSKADILLLDSDQLESTVEGVQSRPLVELRSVDGADFKPEHRRGLYVLLIRNASEHGISAYITRVSSGIQRDVVHMGVGAAALGLIGLVAARTVEKKRAIS